MGRVLTQSTNPIAALYDSVAILDRKVRHLQGKHAILQVQGSNAMTDGDGAIWIDNDDNKIHYVVNGVERTIAHE